MIEKTMVLQEKIPMIFCAEANLAQAEVHSCMYIYIYICFKNACYMSAAPAKWYGPQVVILFVVVLLLLLRFSVF